MRRFSIVAAVFASLTAWAAAADEIKIGDLVVDKAFTYETAASAKAGAGYLVIRNEGETPDRLIGAEGDFPRVMLHQTEEKDGVASMKHVTGIDIPAGGEITLEPGGFHIMFMGLSEPFETGSEIAVTLIFEKAGRVEISMPVSERP